jgi:hypothetical protein
MVDYGPSFTAAKMYRKTSAKGVTYFAGRLGGVKVALLKSKETAENGDEIWSLIFSEAPPYKPRDDAKAESQAPITSLAPPPDRPPRRDFPRNDGPDDEIPF